MKNTFLLIAYLFGIVVFANAQKIQFLNYSVCNPTNLSELEDANVYVQGGGHNFYQSYTMSEHAGSFSQREYAYGSEENPMIVLIDTTGEIDQKKFYQAPVGDLYAGIRGDDMWISEGLWPDYSSEKDPLIGGDLPYEEDAFQCAAENRGIENDEFPDMNNLELKN